MFLHKDVLFAFLHVSQAIGDEVSLSSVLHFSVGEKLLASSSG